ncbi:MAG: DUF3887 domain-containing protein [Eubacteriaceae bacterium]
MKTKRKIMMLSLVLISTIALLSGCASENKNADKNKDKTPEEISVEIVTDLSTGNYSGAMDNYDYTGEMKKAINAKGYEDLWKQLEEKFGKFKNIQGTKVEENGEILSVRVQCVFEKGNLDIQINFDPDQFIAGLFIQNYSGMNEVATAPNTVIEKSITFGEDAFLLSGTLTVPTEGEDFPCVILVHGSGPNDQNETIGANAPFRDIAWSLGEKGIATIRYDKRTKTYGSQMGNKVTPKEEVLDDVVYALEYGRTQPELSQDNIYILGHSLGGYLMPLIAEQTSEARGYIVLGGSTTPLEDLMARQIDYLTGLDGSVGNEEAETIKNYKTAWNKIKDLTEDSNYQPSELMGASKEYWLFLKNYAPVERMKAIEKPILILQGEGDYQVDMNEYKAWKLGLSEKENVTLKSYPGLNHLFIMGNGSKSPDEYKMPGKVSEEVMVDIENFIKSNAIEI